MSSLPLIVFPGFADKAWFTPTAHKEFAHYPNVYIIDAPNWIGDWSPRTDTYAIDQVRLITGGYDCVLAGFSDGAPQAQRVANAIDNVAGLVYIEGLYEKVDPRNDFPVWIRANEGSLKSLIEGTQGVVNQYRMLDHEVDFEVLPRPIASWLNPASWYYRRHPHMRGFSPYIKDMLKWKTGLNV